MKIIHAYVTGLKSVFSNKKMVLLLFGIQLVFALILMTPITHGFEKLFGNSLLGQELLKGNTGRVFVEFLVHRTGIVSLEMKLLVLVGLVYLVVTVFLNGGIIGCFAKRGRFGAGPFFSDAGVYFWRFFRLLLFSGVFLIVAFLIYMLVDMVLMSFKGDSEPAAFFLKAGGFLILGFLFLLIRMVFDFAKIRTVLSRKKGMFRTGLWAWRFVLEHLGRILGLYMLLAVTGLALFVFFTQVMKIIPANTGVLIFALFLWQQIHTLVRSGFKMMSLAAQCTLYRSL